ncbi:MAG: hypothetical protein WBN96_12810 [Gammaproteobacteria bacterium]
MSWCVVQGSPAQTNPNINGDTNTDAVIWRRHERPTDNVFTPQADISLRSALNDAWGSFIFPIINDPDTSTSCGVAECVTNSDIRGEDVNVAAIAVEFNNMINSCQTAYANIGRAGIGITAVNLGLYHNADPEYIGVIGWGGCAEDAAGNCSVPYNGLAAVIDNRYLFPTSPNRSFPGNNDTTGFAYITTDPFDQLTAHEVAHALSLPHRNNAFALMNPSQQDNDADGQTDNLTLNATEVATLRANALNVPGLEIDPPGVFNPGPAQANIMPDPDQLREKLPPEVDIVSVRATSAEKLGNSMEVQLNGMLTPNSFFDVFWLIDADNEPKTGMPPEVLAKLGVPNPDNMTGVELVARVTQRSGDLGKPEAWLWDGADPVPFDVLADLLTMRVEAHLSPYALKSDEIILDKLPPKADLFNIVRLRLPAGIIGPMFNAFAMTVANGEVIDNLGDAPTPFDITPPVFPHCFPDGDGQVGDTVGVKFDGMTSFAGKPFHALLGPNLVATGVIGADGTGAVDLPIPVGTAEGNHLVTIGPDGAALTADCTVTVVDKFACDADLDDDGDVDRVDAAAFAREFGRMDCRVSDK